ncbi:MAG: T9SS type A sorting domain-containing protein, partial [Ferruginibacter sp.]|nr:T9SS type A sorting domain-containing protein [Ferruginibacter sp.]
TSSIETVTVANWAAGTYIVSVFNNGSVIYTARFIKK